MKSLVILVLFILLTPVVNAQIGRNDQTIDTLSVGGDEQDEKMRDMQAVDDFKDELIALRDSVNTYTSSIKQKTNNITETEKKHHTYSTSLVVKLKSDINQLINRLESSRKNEGLPTDAYSMLRTFRQEFNRIRVGVN